MARGGAGRQAGWRSPGHGAQLDAATATMAQTTAPAPRPAVAPAFKRY